jgi:hypothetical protein
MSFISIIDFKQYVKLLLCLLQIEHSNETTLLNSFLTHFNVPSTEKDPKIRI